MAFVTYTSRPSLVAAANGLAVGTAASDGRVSYIKTGNTSHDINDMNGWEPLEVITPFHFLSSDTNTGRAEAIERAVAYAATAQTDRLQDAMNVDMLGETFRVDRTIWISNRTGVDISNGNVEAAGNWSADEAIFDVRSSRQIRFYDMSIEGSHLAPGLIRFRGTFGCAVTRCRGHGPTAFGIWGDATGGNKNGDLTITNNQLFQYYWGESGWDQKANRSATMIKVDSTDHRVGENTVGYCGACLQISVPGGVCEVWNNKFYNDSAMDGDVQRALWIGSIRARSGRIWSNYWGPGILIVEFSRTNTLSGGKSGGVLGYTGNYHIAENGQQWSFVEFRTDRPNDDLAGLVISDNLFDEMDEKMTSGYDVTFGTFGSGSLASGLAYKKRDNLTAIISAGVERINQDARFSL